MSGKRDRQYFGRNFDKFRRLFIIFGANHPDNQCDWKIVKCLINTCTTLRTYDVIEKCHFFKNRKMPEFILPLLRPPNSPDLNLKCVGNTTSQGVQNMHDWSRRTRSPLKTERAMPDHVVIAASVHQWHHLSGCFTASSGHFDNCFLFQHCVFSDKCDLSYCHRSLHANS